MLIPYDSKLSAWKYVEVAVFKRWTDRKTGKEVEAVVREKVKVSEHESLPVYKEWPEEVLEYRDKHDNVGIYTSVFRYDTTDMDTLTRLGSLYFDFDDDDNPEASREDACRLFRHLTSYIPEEFIRVYFTGSKGFHVEAEAIPLGIDPSNDLADIFRFIAEQLRDHLRLPTMDFAVYDPRRMWRLPNSRHQKTNLHKVELSGERLFSSMESIQSWATEPRTPLTPNRISFHPRANEYYKEWTARYEEEKERKKAEALARRMELFSKYGTSLLGGHTRGYVDSVWRTTLESLRSTGSGQRNRTLSQQAYKLYLTFLEADMPYDDVTNTLQGVGVDIGLEEREVEATLKSALRAAEKKYSEDPRPAYGAM